jgi:hypothetical protein
MAAEINLDSPAGAGQIRQLLEKRCIDVKKMVAFEYFRQVTIATPVDTGRMRWGWFITVNAPSNTVPPEGSYSIPDVFSHIEGAVDSVTMGDTFYLTNNVPYVTFVNDGTRKMAGRHFVEIAMTRTKNSLAVLAAKG